jgi:PAS domain S-box-containing protein
MVDINDIIEYSQDLTLLYVEDNHDAREMTSMILEDFFNNIIVAVDGEDGYQKYLDNEVDLIITDINMPKMNGLELCEKIRKVDNTISIVILSAHNEDNFFMESIQHGVNGYLLKPLDIDQLINTIYNIVQKYKYMEEAKTNLHFLEEYKEITNISSIISKTDLNGKITYVNDALCEISGYSREELIGQTHQIIKHPQNSPKLFEEIWDTIENKKQAWKGIMRNRTKNGKSYYVDSIIAPILDRKGNINEYISLRHDVTNIMNPIKQLNDEIKNFKEPLLIYIKIEDFVTIEEFYEHETIDIFQEKVAQCLEKKFSQHYKFDKVYQLDNGEFALLLNYADYIYRTKELIHEIKEIQALVRDEEIPIKDLEYNISLLISISFKKEKILESAKIGIKKLLKTKKTFILANNFASIEQSRIEKNMKTVHMLNYAITNSKIVSYFQPIVLNSTQEIVKYESLVRLIDKDNKVISPYFFLETAKKSNMYLKITNIVLEHSFNILKHCDTDISINLSAIDIEQRSMRQIIFKLLEKHKENTSRVVFELLEDENIKDFRVIRKFISEVKEYGVKIAIDDFGAGYSNYERLLDYQPDILKIDACLIKNIEDCNYSYSAVKSIVTFAKEQKIQTIAEYIENETIYKIIRDLGVDYSQGYYFGKPKPFLQPSDLTLSGKINQ